MFLSVDERKIVKDAIAGENANTLFKAIFTSREGVLLMMNKVTLSDYTDSNIKTVAEWQKIIKASQYHDNLDQRYR